MIKEIQKAILRFKIVIVCNESTICEIKSLGKEHQLNDVIFIKNNNVEDGKVVFISDDELKWCLVYGK